VLQLLAFIVLCSLRACMYEFITEVRELLLYDGNDTDVCNSECR